MKTNPTTTQTHIYYKDIQAATPRATRAIYFVYFTFGVAM